MQRIPSCPADLNRKVINEMKENGSHNHLVAKYVTELANYCYDSLDDPRFKEPMPEARDDVEKLAARVVMDFLKKNSLLQTLQIVEKESKNDTFSENNTSSPKVLHFNKYHSSIRKLVNQRMNLPKEQGWYEIDSRVDTTIVGTDGDFSTFDGRPVMKKMSLLAKEHEEDFIPQRKIHIDGKHHHHHHHGKRKSTKE